MKNIRSIPFKLYIITIVIGLILGGLLILYQASTSLKAILNAVGVSAIMLFAIGWFIFISNHDIFTLPIYGVKSFWTRIAGKKMKKTYIETISDRERIQSKYYIVFWLTSLIYLFAYIIIYFGFYK